MSWNSSNSSAALASSDDLPKPPSISVKPTTAQTAANANKPSGAQPGAASANATASAAAQPSPMQNYPTTGQGYPTTSPGAGGSTQADGAGAAAYTTADASANPAYGQNTYVGDTPTQPGANYNASGYASPANYGGPAPGEAPPTQGYQPGSSANYGAQPAAGSYNPGAYAPADTPPASGYQGYPAGNGYNPGAQGGYNPGAAPAGGPGAYDTSSTVPAEAMSQAADESYANSTRNNDSPASQALLGHGAAAENNFQASSSGIGDNPASRTPPGYQPPTQPTSGYAASPQAPPASLSQTSGGYKPGSTGAQSGAVAQVTYNQNTAAANSSAYQQQQPPAGYQPAQTPNTAPQQTPYTASQAGGSFQPAGGSFAPQGSMTR